MSDDLRSIIIGVIVVASLIIWWNKIKKNQESTNKEIRDIKSDLDDLKNEKHNRKGE